MHGFNTQAELSRQQERTNLVTIQDYADFSSYNIWIPCTDLVDAVGVATISFNGDTPIKIYPDGVTTESVFSFRKPITWKSGNVTTRLHYTGLYVAGTQIRVLSRVEGYAEGGLLTTLGTVSGYNVPTPSADNVYMVNKSAEVANPSTTSGILYVDDSIRLMTFRIRRLGGDVNDTYTSDFELIGVEVMYIEADHVGYGKTVTEKWAY